MPNASPKRWSDGLRTATRRALFDVRITPDGLIHMKHVDGRFGSFEAMELIVGRFLLHHKESVVPLSFADPDAVVAAGWAID